MKVLFAVSNENISEAIIKRYPKEYRELLSYKNVYYFNAILKEIQKDKSYDRIVISEDLEPFVNANHDSIDNFIYEHLDKISDEAQGSGGKETSIILICSERRAPGSSILNKLFSIGIYNALLGKDRNMQELCKLINKPRTKKEAKIYYRIDQATYDPAADMGEVNEVEIQNILTHFRKLGKNTERYADSFNNIAAQYTDEQLKIIINVLPMKVKAVLESESIKYQSLMGAGVESVKNKQTAEMEPGIKINTIGSKSTGVNGPIVIPSGVRRVGPRGDGQVSSGIASRPPQTQQPSQNIVKVQRNNPQVMSQSNVAQPVNRNVQSVQQPVKQVAQTNNQQVNNKQINQNMQQARPVVQNNANVQQTTNSIPKVNPQARFTGNIAQVRSNAQPSATQVVEPVAPEIEENINEIDIDTEEKRGRGRPRKLVTEPPKPKGKRGRPRKNAESDENDLNDLLGNINSEDESVLPGLEEDNNIVLPGFDDETLPGLNDNEEAELPGLEDDDNLLPGIDDSNDEVLPGLDEEEILPGLENNDNSLPGLEDFDEGVLPGIDEEETELPELEEPEGEEVDVSSLLAGLDNLDGDEGVLPGVNNNEEVELPGLEDDDNLLPGIDDNDDSLLPGIDDNDDSLLPGIDDSDDGLLPGLNDNDDSLLPGLDDSDDGLLPGIDDSDDGLLPGIDDSDDELLSGLDEEETMLPGMGFQDTVDTPKNPPINQMNNQNYNNIPKQNTTAVESIKPKIDYSMSNLNSLMSKDKKIVTFLGTTKNGTSFLVNNIAVMLGMMGVDVAILDMTQNRNSYYIFTDSKEELRNIAYTSISKLENGYAEGIKAGKNLTVYTALPADGNTYENAEPILSTLVQNHSLVLIDCDFETPPAYFASCQEIYLVQSMDILTIQPLTAFLRELKFKGAWEPEKVRVVINKEVSVKCLSEKIIVAGMSRYNGPDMTVMTDLFNRDMVKACSIPFDEKVYSKYLETMATCKLSVSGYPKYFMEKLRMLGEMVYPRLNGKSSYSPNQRMGNMGMNAGNGFSNSTNNTLNKMKNRY